MIQECWWGWQIVTMGGGEMFLHHKRRVELVGGLRSECQKLFLLCKCKLSFNANVLNNSSPIFINGS